MVDIGKCIRQLFRKAERFIIVTLTLIQRGPHPVCVACGVVALRLLYDYCVSCVEGERMKGEFSVLNLLN